MYLWMVYTVKSRYNAVQYTMINSTAQIIAGIEADYQSEAEPTQKKHHTSPWRASYVVSVVSILEEIDHIITAPHCITDKLCHTWTYITYGLIVLPKWLTACVPYPTGKKMTSKSCSFLWIDK